jgi:ubiquinone/menaquinone biosynthesis C-methylase UbiE
MAAWKQKRRHVRYYNRVAPTYDVLYQEEQRLKMDVALRHVELPPRSCILDLGCGTGLLALSKIGEKARMMIGLDVSKGMLNLSNPSVRSTSVHLVLADADHTPLRRGCFDGVFAITLLQNMPNPLETLREIRQLAKLDAPIVVTGLKKRFTPDSFRQLLESAKLEAKLVATDEKVKCHIALCTRRRSRGPSRGALHS